MMPHAAQPTVGGPGINPQGVVPPPSVPLGFLGAGGIGLFGFGVAAWLAADRIVATPTAPGAVAATHLAMLAFLTVAVLGAVHQFGPVAGRRQVRSVAAARLTLVGIVATGWLLPNGFTHGPDWLVPAAGLLGAASVTVAAWNLSPPLLARDGGVPVAGLRLSVAYLLITVAFGVVYAFNRETGWFPLYPSRVLAHAHLGLLGWLGLTYVSVAEKLWPMFLLSHRPSARSGVVAVSCLGAGVLPLALGLLLSAPWLAGLGAVLVVVGLSSHVVSFAASLRHRRRPLELLHGFLLASMVFLAAGVVAGTLAATLPLSGADRARLVTTEVAALAAWLGLAVIGHAHKIVPFITYTALRGRGLGRHGSGRPLLFSDLYRKLPARFTLAMGTTGFALLVVGILAGSALLAGTGGITLAATALVVITNLALTPLLLMRAAPPTTSPTSRPRPPQAIPRKDPPMILPPQTGPGTGADTAPGHQPGAWRR